MINLQVIDYAALIAFWLSFARWSAVLFQLPLFDQMPVPPLVKILTSLLITYAFYPFTSSFVIADIKALGVDNFWSLTIYYTFIGLIIGHFVKIIMMLYVSAGSIITQQVGFGAIRYFDPSSGQQVGPFEQLIHWTVLIMILSSGALMPMFKGVLESFSSIQATDLGHFKNIHIFFIDAFKSIFISAIMLASPLIFTNILIMTVLGIIARTVPQMNIIMVSFVVNIGFGLLVFAASSEEFFTVAYKMYVDKLAIWFQFVS